MAGLKIYFYYFTRFPSQNFGATLSFFNAFADLKRTKGEIGSESKTVSTNLLTANLSLLCSFSFSSCLTRCWDFSGVKVITCPLSILFMLQGSKVSVSRRSSRLNLDFFYFDLDFCSVTFWIHYQPLPLLKCAVVFSMNGC